MSISNLHSFPGSTWVKWTWTNPSDPDFSYTEIYLNSIHQTNTFTEFYNATPLIPNTQYTLSTRTVDTSGNINTTWVNNTAITHITPPPYITITSPQNITYYTTSINLNYTLNKPVEWTGYSLDGKPNQSIIPPGSNTTITNLSEGSHTVTVYANDTTGNISSSMVMFEICTTPKGDLNHDGNITSADVRIALEIVFRGEYLEEADMDENGYVNILDARMIMLAAAGNIELLFPL